MDVEDASSTTTSEVLYMLADIYVQSDINRDECDKRGAKRITIRGITSVYESVLYIILLPEITQKGMTIR